VSELSMNKNQLIENLRALVTKHSILIEKIYLIENSRVVVLR